MNEIIEETVELLLNNGNSWHRIWAACQNAIDDDYGNMVTINAESTDGVLVEFQYAIGGSVELLHLSTIGGALRLARIIEALASPDTE